MIRAAAGAEMTVDECRSWLAERGAAGLDKEYPVAPSEALADYIEKAGTESLDGAIEALCDAYLAGSLEVRRCGRDFGERPRSLHNSLVGYVSRMASALKRDQNPRWIRLEIAAAAIEDARLDHRDLIVGLIIPRWAAERMGLDACVEFDALAPLATESTGKLIRGISPRSASEVEHTVRQMAAALWSAAFPA